MATGSLAHSISSLRDPKLLLFKWRTRKDLNFRVPNATARWSSELKINPSPLRLQSPSPTLPLTKINTNVVLFTSNFCRKDSIFSIEPEEEEEEEEGKVFVFEEITKKAASIAALTFLGLLINHDAPNLAIAATGGRMGGKSSSSSSSSRSSSLSSSRSSSSSSSQHSSSPSYSSSTSPITSISYSSSTTYAPSPIRTSSRVAVDHVSLTIIALIIGAFIASAFSSSTSASHHDYVSAEKTSVIKLQVCLLGLARSLQRELDEIAEVADISTSEGLNYILKETILSLLRHPDFWISCHSSVDVKRNSEDGEKHFDQLSIEERAKFDVETLVNVNKIKRKKGMKTQEDNGSSNEYIVVTILVAAEGVEKIPSITSSEELKEALQKLGSISSRKTMAVEALWTPQEENDTLSDKDLLEDYPLLRPLQDGGPNLTL